MVRQSEQQRKALKTLIFNTHILCKALTYQNDTLYRLNELNALQGKKTKNMEEKILIYQDKEVIDNAIFDYRKAKAATQKIVDVLKKHKIETDMDLVVALINRETSVSSLVGVDNDNQDLPEALKKVIHDDNIQVIQEINAAINEAEIMFNQNMIYGVDLNKLLLINGLISISDEALQEAEDRGSVYTDNENRKLIYEQALAAKKALEELQVSLNNSNGGKSLLAITPPNCCGLLVVQRNGEIEIMNQLFENIL